MRSQIIITKDSEGFFIRYDRHEYLESISFSRKDPNDAIKLIKSLLVKMEEGLKEPSPDSKLACGICGKSNKPLYLLEAKRGLKRDRVIGSMFACRDCWLEADGKDIILRNPDSERD